MTKYSPRVQVLLNRHGGALVVDVDAVVAGKSCQSVAPALADRADFHRSRPPPGVPIDLEQDCGPDDRFQHGPERPADTETDDARAVIGQCPNP